MGKTLIIFGGKYGDGSAGSKRVRQFAMGLRRANDQAAVVSYYRGVRHPEGPIPWEIDQWDVPHTGVNVALGGVRSLCVARDALTLSPRLAELAERLCGEQGFDRILLYGTGWVFLRTVVRRLIRLRLPMVADFNEWMSFKARAPLYWLDQELFRRVCLPKLSGIVGISPFWEAYAKRLSKAFLRIPAMSDDEFSKSVPLEGDEFNLVYVGVLFRRDLPATMLAGVRLAIERGAQFVFHIVGRLDLFPESIASLKQIGADPVLRDRVKVHGWVSRDLLQQIYSKADSFLLLRENNWDNSACFPTRLPEFMATGITVISSNTDNLAPRLVHRENAWLLPPGHAPAELADAICHLATHPAERMYIGDRGKESARTQFYFEEHGRKLKLFLDNLPLG